MSDDVSEKIKNNKKSKKRRNSDPDWEPSGTKKKKKLDFFSKIINK